MQEKESKVSPPFSSPEEELRYLRSQVEAKERELAHLKEHAPYAGAEREGAQMPREKLIKEEVSRYRKETPEKTLAPEHRLSEEDEEAITLNLAPEEHDKQMEELAGILREKGIRNALSVVDRMSSPHLEDDFHRFLVQYVKSGFPVPGARPKGPVWNVLRMTLYEVVPHRRKEEGERPLKELLSSMEQLYAGMLSQSSDGARHFTFELALSDKSDEIVFYAAVPDNKKDLFEKQVYSIFHDAELKVQENDYNVFVEGGASFGARAGLAVSDALPLKTYESFDHDPFSVMLNALSKIESEGGGAAVQFVFSPAGASRAYYYKNVLKKLGEGRTFGQALKAPKSVGGEFFHEAKSALLGAPAAKKKNGEQGASATGQTPIETEEVRRKASSIPVDVNLRIIASAKSAERAEEILSHLESSFNQFENPQGNKLRFSRIAGRESGNFFKEFSFREFAHKSALPLTVAEATTLIHIPAGEIAHGQFRQTAKTAAPAPVGLPKEGTLLGINRFRDAQTEIYIGEEDRLRHLYAIGQTGTGKTTLLKNMIVQDIRNGKGACMIDPHGSDIEDILAAVPEERHEDVIYFDPSHTERVLSLNMLEYDSRLPEQKTFVVNELFSIFQKLYASTPEAMGPMFEQYFRNATQLVMEDPETSNTLLDVSRVLVDAKYRAIKLAACKNPIVTQFWKDIAAKAGGEQSLQNIVPYITSKFDVFAANDYMRPLIAQQRSTFNFRDIMDNRKILLVNLSKGRLGDINAHLIGLILIGKILMAALSRVSAPDRLALPPFYLYIDEFQNITTDSIAAILSEARKYKLGLTVAHQFIAQLDPRIKDAVFGNVGSLAVFRTGPDDAKFLESQLAPTFAAQDIINLENHNAYVRLLAGGEPQKPFSINVLPPETGDSEKAERLKNLSYEKYGRPRREVEEMIRKRYAAVL